MNFALVAQRGKMDTFLHYTVYARVNALWVIGDVRAGSFLLQRLQNGRSPEERNKIVRDDDRKMTIFAIET